MARILYGVMGDARGHLSRSLAVAQALPDHDFLFAGGGVVREVRDYGFAHYELPMLATVHKNNHVDAFGTILNGVRVLLRPGPVLREYAALIRDFQPDLIITDYEYYTPRAAHLAGYPCLSLDHQHIISHGRYSVPPHQLHSRAMFMSLMKLLFSRSDRHWATSFYQLAPVDESVKVFPPILRPDVREITPGVGEHALVYISGSRPDENILDVFREVDRPFHIYGYGKRPDSGNLSFRKTDRMGFLEDLAASRYVISSGGHSLISESLYYGKPLFCFPISLLYEQFCNVWFLRKQGYGDFSMTLDIGPERLRRFEENLDAYAEAVAQESFWGNDLVAKSIEFLIREGRGRPRSY